jgi:para-aminobenzoate synthetase/4-amino-4-deoxychorismate lyase
MNADAFRLVETMRFDGLTIPLFDRHVARMERSAAHFGFPFREERMRTRVEAALDDCEVTEVRRVRATLGPGGTFEVTTAPIREPNDDPRTLVFAGPRVDPDDEFLRHKTTRRGVYEQAQREAEAAGADEAILVNERGEVTEATWSTLFVQQGDAYVTPPVSCGCVPGVFRARLLDTQSTMHEGVISREDVHDADALFCCNAIRGWQRAVLAAPERV